MYSYINDKHQKISGSAAFNHEVFTVHGGIKEYNSYIGNKYISWLFLALIAKKGLDFIDLYFKTKKKEF